MRNRLILTRRGASGRVSLDIYAKAGETHIHPSIIITIKGHPVADAPQLLMDRLGILSSLILLFVLLLATTRGVAASSSSPPDALVPLLAEEDGKSNVGRPAGPINIPSRFLAPARPAWEIGQITQYAGACWAQIDAPPPLSLSLLFFEEALDDDDDEDDGAV